MMFWYDHGVGAWGWVAMTLGMILFWGLFIGLGVLLFRALNRDSGSLGTGLPPTTAPHAGPTPERLLAERYARGEIDDEEYRRRLDTLRTLHSTPGARHDGADDHSQPRTRSASEVAPRQRQ